jgi:hypothetical protein
MDKPKHGPRATYLLRGVRRSDGPARREDDYMEPNNMTVTMQAIWTAFLVSVFVAAGAANAADRDADLAKILAKLEDQTPYELTLSTPETGETPHCEGMLNPSLDLTLRTCLAADGRGAFRAVIRLPAADRTLTLRTAGPAEDFYLVYALELDEPFAKWLQKARAAVEDSPGVVIDSDQAYTLRPHGRVDPVPSDYLQVVAAVAAKYEEKRPQLVLRARRRSHRSWLFFPPAAKAGWGVRRNGDRLVVTTSCADRMYVARFDIEFRKNAGGWEYVRLHAREEFKGE